MNKICSAFIILTSVLYGMPLNAQTNDVVDLSPVQSIYNGTLESRGVDYVVINGTQYGLAPGLVFYNLDNSYIPLFSAPLKWKKIKYSFDLMGQAHKIWLISEN